MRGRCALSQGWTHADILLEEKWWIEAVLNSLDALDLDCVSVSPYFPGRYPFLPGGTKAHTPFGFSPILPRWFTVVYVSSAKCIDEAQAPPGTGKLSPSLWLGPPYTHHSIFKSLWWLPTHFHQQSDDIVPISEKKMTQVSAATHPGLICKLLWKLHSSGTMDFQTCWWKCNNSKEKKST